MSESDEWKDQEIKMSETLRDNLFKEIVATVGLYKFSTDQQTAEVITNSILELVDDYYNKKIKEAQEKLKDIYVSNEIVDSVFIEVFGPGLMEKLVK